MAEYDISLRFIDEGVVDGFKKIQSAAEELSNTTDGLNDSLKVISNPEDIQKGLTQTTKVIVETDDAIDEMAESLDDVAESNEKATKSLKDSVKNYKVFGVSLNDIQGKLGLFSTSLKSTATGLRASTAASGGLVKGLQILKVALISTGIGAIVVALGSLVALFTKTQQGIDKVSVVAKVLGSVFDNIIDRVAILGESVVKVLQGDFSGAVETAKTAFKGLGDEILRDAAAAAELEKRSQALRDREIELIPILEEKRSKIEEARLVAQDESVANEERLKKIIEARTIEKEIEEERLKNAKENLSIILESNDLANSLTPDLEAAAEAEAELSRIRSQSNRNNRRFLAFQQTIEKQQAAASKARLDQIKKEQEAQQKLVDDFRKLVANLEKENEAIELEFADPTEKVEKQYEIAVREINQQAELIQEAARKAGIAEVDIQDEITELLKAAEKRRNNALEQIRLEAQNQQLSDIDLNSEINVNQVSDNLDLDAILNAEEEAQKEILNIQAEAAKEKLEILSDQSGKEVELEISKLQKLISENEKAVAELNKIAIGRGIDQREELALQELELLEDNTEDILTLEEDKERKRLEIALQGAKARLALLGEEDGFEFEKLSNQIEILEKRLEDFDSGISSKPIFDKLKLKLQDALNLDDAQFAAFEQSVSLILENVDNAITQSIDNQIEEQDRLLESIQERREVTEDALEEEIEKQEQGYANNVAGKRKELEQVQIAEEAAIKKKNELEEKQRKIELARQAVLQITNIVTASSEIFKANAGIPVVGLAIAAAAIASMFALFASAKSQAKQASRLYTGGKMDLDSGFVDRGGVSDIPGRGDGYRVVDNNGVEKMRIGGSEFVMNEAVSMEHLPFLEDINAGVYNGVDLTKRMMPNYEVIRVAERNTNEIIDRDNKPSGLTKEDIREVVQEHMRGVIDHDNNKPKESSINGQRTLKKGRTTKVWK